MKTRTFIAILSLLVLFYISPFSIVAVTGDSMEPTLPQGSAELVYETQNVAVGDIIVFYSDYRDEMIIHRITEDQPDGFITQGDNNDQTDQAVGYDPVTYDAITGKTVELFDKPVYIPYLGTIFIQTQQNRVFFITTIAALYLISQSLQTKTEKRFSETLVVGDILNPLFFSVLIILSLVIVFSATSVTAPFVYTDSSQYEDRPYVIDYTNQGEPTTIVIDKQQSYGQEVYQASNLEIVEISRTETQIELVVIPPEVDTQGAHPQTINIYQFPPYIPTVILDSLIQQSIGLAAVISSILVVSPIYILYVFLGDMTAPINNSKNRTLYSLIQWLNK